VKKYVFIFLFLIIAPLLVSTANYLLGDRRGNWQTADRSSAGLLPVASDHPDALIRIYAARTVRWRGIFAVHTWIVLKDRGASRYSRYDYTAWGEPIRVDGFAADGRWFGALPQAVVSVDGQEAERLIPKIRSVIDTYRFRAYGDYSAWPGPNSNTFVQAVLDAVPELKAVLPPTAIGRRHRGQLPRRRPWLGYSPPRIEVSRHRPARRAADAVAFAPPKNATALLARDFVVDAHEACSHSSPSNCSPSDLRTSLTAIHVSTARTVSPTIIA
jgi:hypothetical protein